MTTNLLQRKSDEVQAGECEETGEVESGNQRKLLPDGMQAARTSFSKIHADFLQFYSIWGLNCMVFIQWKVDPLLPQEIISSLQKSNSVAVLPKNSCISDMGRGGLPDNILKNP